MKLFSGFIFLVFGLFWGACHKQDQGPESPHPVALLNGKPISRSDFESFVHLRQGELTQEGAGIPQSDLFREFVTEKLLEEEADKRGIQVSDREVWDSATSWLPEGGTPQPALLEHTRRFLRGQRLVSTLVRPKVTVTPSEVQEYYRSHEEEFIVDDGVRVFEILVAEKEQAQRIRRQLRAGDRPRFESAARQYSHGVTASQGGDLGVFKRGELPQEFERVIFGLKRGQLSPVFASGRGYHIFMVIEWLPRRIQSFSEAQNSIFEKLAAQKERAVLHSLLEEIFQKASLEILDDALEFDWRESDAVRAQ